MQRSNRAANKLENAKSKAAVPFEELKNEEIVGVNVLSLNEMPENPLGKRKTQAEEEEKKGEPMALPDPKKKPALKKAQTHRDEGAFQTYIFRVCKDVCPEHPVTKKAMNTLNHIIADKFEQIMTESRGLIVNTKKGTLTSKEIEIACKLLITGELG